MTVSWVNGSTAVDTTATSISSNAPSGIASGDTLLAAVFARTALTTPTGWTKLAETAQFTNGSFVQKLTLFSKTTVTTADASASFTFAQAFSDRIGVAYAVVRGGTNLSIATAVVNSTSTDSVTPPTLTASASGAMLLVFGSPIIEGIAGTTPTGPTLFTVTSGAATAPRLAVAYRAAVGTGQSNSGDINFAPGESTHFMNGLGAITALIQEPVIVNGYVAVAGPLGAPSVLAQYAPVSVIAAAPSPLQAPAIHAQADISAQIDPSGATVYVMDLATASGLVRVPIGSWQATLRSTESSYVQCVVSACSPWVDLITSAAAFQVSRRTRLLDGTPVEIVVAGAPLQTPSLAQGSSSYSATLSGYSPAVNAPATVSRELSEIRTVFTYSTGYVVRCTVDWRLLPGHTASFSGTDFTVRYVSYYVNEGDAFMDVGQ